MGSCIQQFPETLSGGWSQAQVVQVNGTDRIVLCGGAYVTGCWVWTPTGWQSMNTTQFNKRLVAAGSLLEDGWLVTGGIDDSSNGLSSVIYYANDEWIEYPSMPFGVRDHCHVTVDSDVFVI